MIDADFDLDDEVIKIPLQFINEDVLFPDHGELSKERLASRKLLDISFKTSSEAFNCLGNLCSYEEFSFIKQSFLNKQFYFNESGKFCRSRSRDTNTSPKNPTFSYSHSQNSTTPSFLFQNYKASIENCLKSRSNTYAHGFDSANQNATFSQDPSFYITRSHTFQVLEKVPEHLDEVPHDRDVPKEMTYNQIFLEMVPRLKLLSKLNFLGRGPLFMEKAYFKKIYSIPIYRNFLCHKRKFE